MVDAAVVLLARIHVEGFYWGDCSLSNLLFRRDAGSLMAYLVDAETAERPATLPAGLREPISTWPARTSPATFSTWRPRVCCRPTSTCWAWPTCWRTGTRSLWEELTASLEIDLRDRHLIDGRLRRLNDLGFDVGELIVEHERVRLPAQGHAGAGRGGPPLPGAAPLTGLEVQENQARRLLNDIAAFGAYLSRVEAPAAPSGGRRRWIAEVYEPIIARIPPDLRGRLEPPELFHELLEHRYYLSEAAGHEVDNETALLSYIENVLRFRRDERLIFTDEVAASRLLAIRAPVE